MIKDSGERRVFGDNPETSAVRDMSEGKGRFDLVPMDTVYSITRDEFFMLMHEELFEDAARLVARSFYENKYDALLDLAIHFENGARKYKENNWRTGTGIPAESYIDSAIRHYCKAKSGWTDEPHATACLWNLVCLMWSMANLYGADPNICEDCEYWCDDKESDWYLKCVLDNNLCDYKEKIKCHIG